MLRRIGPEGPEAGRLTRALAVLGGPAPLRQAAALAGLDLPAAARLADRLRAADVLAPGSVLEFAHPIVRTAVYESIPPGERALAHAEAARLLERDGTDAERLALHLLRSEPGGDPRVAALLRAAAAAATGRGDPGAAAACLRRALDEPPPAADRPGLLLELGIALARERSPAAVPALREAVELAGPDAALLAARVLGIWAYHAEAAAICRNALAGPVPDDLADSLQAELFQNAVISAETVAEAVTLPRRTGRSAAWAINDALLAATSADGGAITLPALDGISPDSMGAVYALLVLIWAGELEVAGRICDTVLADARRRGSMSMVAHASCLHSMIMRRLGRLEEAADAARLALDFKLATSPPLAVAWAAALGVDALTRLGRLDEADAMAAVAAGREPPEGWIHTLTFRQARGALRVAQHRPDEALADLLAAGEGWQALGVTNPAVASWRTAAVAAYRALGQHDEAAALAARAARAGAQGWQPGNARHRAARARGPGRGDRRPRSQPGPLRAGPGPGRTRRQPAPLRPADAGQGAAAPRARSRRAHRRRRAGRRGEAGAARGRGPAPAGRPDRPGRADRGRAAGRRPGGRRREQPADRRAPVHHPGHGRDPPAARLPQAQHHLPRRPPRHPGH